MYLSMCAVYVHVYMRLQSLFVPPRLLVVILLILFFFGCIVYMVVDVNVFLLKLQFGTKETPFKIHYDR